MPSAEFMRDSLGIAQDSVYAILLTITHPMLAEPIYLCNDTVLILPDAGIWGLVSNGQEYIFMPFTIILPNMEADTSTMPQAKITIDVTDLEIMVTMRQIAGFGPPSLSFSIIRSINPDTVEIQLDGFVLTQINYDVGSITGNLTLENFNMEPYPAVTFTPSRFPGIFVGSIDPTVGGS